MKNLNNIKLFAILMAIAAWSVLFINMPKPNKVIENPNYGGAERNFDKEKKNGAAIYEFNRLKDPATGMMPPHIRARELAFVETLPKDADMNGEDRMKSGSLTWASRGPYNLGGRTRALAIDIMNDSIILAGSVSGNMWRSADQGNTWNTVTSPAMIHTVTCIAQDIRPNHTNTWYYGTGEYDGTSASANYAYALGNGLFKSTDNGLTWTSLTATAPNDPELFTSDYDFCWNLAVDPTDTADNIYAAFYDGIYRSENGGTTWASVLYAPSNTQQSNFTDIAIANNGAKYATMSSDGPTSVIGIRRSVNGTTWTNITPDSFPTVYERIVIGIDPNNENNIYFFGVTPGAGMASSCTYNYVPDSEYYSLWKYTYISGNGDSAGGSWVNLSANIPYNGSQMGNYYGQGGYDMYIKVKPGDSNVVFIAGTNIFRSTDAFTSQNNWLQIGGYGIGTSNPDFVQYPNDHCDEHQMRFFHNNPNAMITSCDGGVFKTMDNTQDTTAWISCNNGYLASQFYTCALDHATPNNNIITGGLQDNGTYFTDTNNVTAPWAWVCKGDGANTFVFDNHPFYYCSWDEGKLYKTQLDAVGNVLAFRRIDPIGGGGYQWVAPLAVDPNNNNLIYWADSSHVWRNTDLSVINLSNQFDSISTNWSKIDSINSGDGQITAMSVSTTPANRVYFGTINQKIYRIDNANVGNPTAVNIGTNLHYNGGGSVSCLAVDPTNANNVLCVFSNYSVRSLYYSSNGGTSWTDISGNLEQHPSGAGDGPSCRWANIQYVNGNPVYWVGTSTGLWATTVLGDSLTTQWVQQGSNTIGNAIVDMIDSRASDGTVIVATHGNGMYSTTITDVNQLGVGIPVVKSLTSPLQLRNYPNPADQSTTISFNLPINSTIELNLFDIKGNKISTIYKGVKGAGLSSIQINTSSLAGGIYFYHLVAGDISETRKIIVAH